MARRTSLAEDGSCKCVGGQGRCETQLERSHFLFERVDNGSNVPVSPKPATSSNFGSPKGSGPDLDGVGHRSHDAQFKELRDVLGPLLLYEVL